MVKANEIKIGSILKTSRGEYIKVESISTKRQHRKVGYHREGELSRIRYVRLVECEKVATPCSEIILTTHGWTKHEHHEFLSNEPYEFVIYELMMLDENKKLVYAELSENNVLNIWTDYHPGNDGMYSDVSVVCCDTIEKLNAAFEAAGVKYHIDVEFNHAG